VSLNKLEQLLAFCEWEKQHNPHPQGKQHIAEWAYAEIMRLRAEQPAYEPLTTAAIGAIFIRHAGANLNGVPYFVAYEGPRFTDLVQDVERAVLEKLK